MTDMQFQQFVSMGRISQRKTAPAAIGQQNIHIMPRQELQALGAWQLQEEPDHVPGASSSRRSTRHGKVLIASSPLVLISRAMMTRSEHG